MSTQMFVLKLFSVILPCLLLGCAGEENQTRGQRIPVDGVVTLDGDHLVAGRIIFISDQGAGAVKATATIVQGYYKFDAENGPLQGTARVEIYPEQIELEQFESARGGDPNQIVDLAVVDIPSKYNLKSELTAELQSDAESNLFNFELSTK
ncbi:MAG: hypothetical protein ABJZ55_25150 [Fuerstiella sp.]